VQRVEGRPVGRVGREGTPPALRVIESRTGRNLAALAGWLLAVFLLLPHATLLLISFVPVNTWTTQTLPPVLSVVNYRRMFTEAERLRPMLNSLWNGDDLDRGRARRGRCGPGTSSCGGARGSARRSRR